MVDPVTAVPADSSTAPRGWQAVLAVNALVWEVMLARLLTALQSSTETWELL